MNSLSAAIAVIAASSRSRRARVANTVSEAVSRSIVTLPISASMTVADARYVTKHFLELYRTALA